MTDGVERRAQTIAGAERQEPAAGGAERRQGDRRRSTERRRVPLPSDESLFGATGIEDGPGAVPDSRFGNGWKPAAGGADGAVDSRFLTRQARRLSAEGRGAFQRIYRAFVGARAALGVALLAAQVLGALFAPQTSPAPLLLCLFYAAQTLSLWMLPRFRRLPDGAVALPRATWLATIGFDLVVFVGLHLLDPAPGPSRAALLVLPVLMAGVLTTRVRALATAAGVTLLLLLDAGRPALEGGDIAAALTQAGFAGIGFFGLTLLAGELAGRLAREELTARGSIELARQQAQLNRLVIEELVEGVLVVDRRGRVRAANPAARRLLVADGLGPAAPFQLDADPAWAKLARLIEQAFSAGALDGARELTLVFANGATRGLRLRARFTRRRAASSDSDGSSAAHEEVYCVLFVEDLRVVEARTRQEKLAAMGRVSAGIAHEIRNPLAAISQANALLQEDIVAPDQQRLAQMVADNVARLERIVADVLDVAPGTSPTPSQIDAVASVATVLADWCRASGVPAAGPQLHTALPSAALVVVFDPEHLRRVLVNLLDNAHRHASMAAGSLAVELAADGADRVRLTVSNDGAPIVPDVERHLFEPFFSTRSRGSGLGLYICRELCERYGASIDFRLAPPGQPRRNQFRVSMRRVLPGEPVNGPA
jgi:two-component system sensor histidine kinase PilS (NtrC family)